MDTDKVSYIEVIVMKTQSLLEIVHAPMCWVNWHDWGDSEEKTDVTGRKLLVRPCVWCTQEKFLRVLEDAPKPEPAKPYVGPTIMRMLEIRARGEAYRVQPSGFKALPKESQEFVRSISPGARPGFGKMGNDGIFDCMRARSEEAEDAGEAV